MLNKEKILMIKAEEILLLHAILEKNDSAALSYFEQWTEAVEFDNVEIGSVRLLPLLYKRMASTSHPVPHLNKLKGIYRKALYRNSLLFHKTFPVLAELEKMGIPVILLKGTALVAAYYEDIGARPMDDVDFLVREEDLEKTLLFFDQLGWQRKYGHSINKPVKHIQGFGLLSPEGYGLDIHWRVFYQCPWDGADLELWKQSETIDFRGLSMRILNPTLQIMHNCSHGVRWNSVSSIRWIVDVLKIMEKRADAIDWKLLVSESANRKLSLTMLHALRFLNSQFIAGIPDDILNRLSALPKDPREYRLFQILNSPPCFGNMNRRWIMHSYSMDEAPFWKKIALFPDFLKNVWGLQARYQLPFYVLKRIWQKLAERYSVCADNQRID